MDAAFQRITESEYQFQRAMARNQGDCDTIQRPSQGDQQVSKGQAFITKTQDRQLLRLLLFLIKALQTHQQL